MIKIDKIDRKILSILNIDSSKSYVDIGKILNISSVTVQQRIVKLKKQKIILGYSLNINYSLLGFKSIAFVGLFLEYAKDYDEVLEKLKKIPNVLECYYTTGVYSLFLKICAEDNSDLMFVLKKIQDIEKVSRTETFVSLDDGFKRNLNFD